MAYFPPLAPAKQETNRAPFLNVHLRHYKGGQHFFFRARFSSWHISFFFILAKTLSASADLFTVSGPENLLPSLAAFLPASSLLLLCYYRHHHYYESSPPRVLFQCARAAPTMAAGCVVVVHSRYNDHLGHTKPARGIVRRTGSWKWADSVKGEQDCNAVTYFPIKFPT